MGRLLSYQIARAAGVNGGDGYQVRRTSPGGPAARAVLSVFPLVGGFWAAALSADVLVSGSPFASATEATAAALGYLVSFSRLPQQDHPNYDPRRATRRNRHQLHIIKDGAIWRGYLYGRAGALVEIARTDATPTEAARWYVRPLSRPAGDDGDACATERAALAVALGYLLAEGGLP